MIRTNTFLFTGPQASGKGTQARILAKKINAEYIEMGALLRAVSKQETELGNYVAGILKSGNLVKDDVLEKVLDQKLKDITGHTENVILDGVPRKMAQAHFLVDFLQSHNRGNFEVIFINIPRKISVLRLGLRRTCENCRMTTLWNGHEDQICSNCGGKLLKREDDTDLDAVNRRLDLYVQETLPVVYYLKTIATVHEIDGSPSIEEVSESIDKALGVV